MKPQNFLKLIIHLNKTRKFVVKIWSQWNVAGGHFLHLQSRSAASLTNGQSTNGSSTIGHAQKFDYESTRSSTIRLPQVRLPEVSLSD